jgi:hypothetical protein
MFIHKTSPLYIKLSILSSDINKYRLLRTAIAIPPTDSRAERKYESGDHLKLADAQRLQARQPPIEVSYRIGFAC